MGYWYRSHPVEHYVNSHRYAGTHLRMAKMLILTTLMAAVPLGLSGCGKGEDLGKPVDVSGKVTMDGKASSGVEVVFTRTTPGGGAKERDFIAKANDSGEYKLTGVYPANYLVRIVDPKPIDPQKQLAVNTGPYVKYESESSPLVADVKAGQQEFSFNLTSN